MVGIMVLLVSATRIRDLLRYTWITICPELIFDPSVHSPMAECHLSQAWICMN